MFAIGSWDALKLHYIEVPVYAIYHYSKRADVYFGLAAGRLFYFDLTNSPRGQYTSTFINKFYTNELSFLFGGYYHLHPNLAATVRLCYSPDLIYNVGTGNVVLNFGLHLHLFPKQL